MEGSDQWSKRILLSLEYHRLSAKKLLADPSLLGKVRDNLAGIVDANGESAYTTEWAIILKAPVETICEFIVTTGEHYDELRHASPVAGLISQQERREIYERVMVVKLNNSCGELQDIESLFRKVIERAGYAAVLDALGPLAQEMNPTPDHLGLWVRYKKECLVVRHDSSGFICFRVDRALERLKALVEIQIPTHFIDLEAF